MHLWDRRGGVYVTKMQNFDFETKTWQPLPYMAEYAGNYLYVATKTSSDSGVIYRYHIVNNVWDTPPRFESSKSYNQEINCLCSVNEYVYAISDSKPLQRYSSTQNKWQSGSTLPFLKNNSGDRLRNVAAVVMKSKIYVLHGCQGVEGRVTKYKSAVFHCFDPQKNEWKQKASTSFPHFGSSLLVDNSKLYVAGGSVLAFPYGDPAPVEVYSEENNNWVVVDQTHIPPNNLGAVEVEGKVYFIINKFPFDSGIRVPPGEVYHISLHEWERKLGISEIRNAALCYMPVKKESLENKATNEKKASVKEEAKKGTEFR